jgi:hypothetical protein
MQHSEWMRKRMDCVGREDIGSAAGSYARCVKLNTATFLLEGVLRDLRSSKRRLT